MPELFTSFEGRISRREFWLGLIVAIVVLFIVSLAVGLLFQSIASFAGLASDTSARQAFLIYFNLPVLAAFAWSFFALIVKRCHDRGRPGWWALLVLIPVLSWIWLIVDLGLMPGDMGINLYGHPPGSDGEGV